MFRSESEARGPGFQWRAAFALAAGTILAGIMVVVAPSVAAAATFTVNSTADAVDAAPGDGACATAGSVCTLRAAIMEANALGGADTIVFAASTNGTPFTLSLTGSEADTGDAAINDLDVFADLTITGNGPSDTIIQAGASAAAGIDRVFELGVVGTVKVDVAMSGLTIRHGKSSNGFGAGISFWGCSTFTGSTTSCDGTNQGTLTLNNVHVVNNLEQSAGANGFGGGGGILIEQAHLTINNSTISNNEATLGWGGGIAVIGQDSTLDISNSTIANNQAPAKLGGGIYYERDSTAPETFTITGSTISGNSAGGKGGGLYIELRNNTHVTITDTTISGNTSTQSGANSGGGGGIWTSVPAGFQTTLERVTISGNTVNNGADTQFGGGGMHHGGGTLTLKNVTISGNRSAFRGGGLVLSDNGGTATLTNVTITDNHADNNNSGGETGGGLYVDETESSTITTTVLHNTIVAKNYRGSGTGTADDGGGSGAISGTSSYNLFGTGGSGTLSGGTGNQYNVADPKLGPLADNGGATQTHALQIGSPALDAGGSVASLPTTDQRGAPRSMDAAEDSDGDGNDDEDATDEPDVGAYEAHPTIEDQVDLTIPEDTTPHNVAIGIGDPSHVANENITVTSSNTTLVASPGAVNLGPAPGPTVAFNLTPGANQFGTTTITVTFTDTVPVIGGSRIETDTFTITVTPVADPPTVSGTTTDEDVMLTSVISRNAVDGAEVTHATFSSITGGTLYQSDGATAVTPGAFYALDGSGDLTVKFRPDADANSQEGDSFNFTVRTATSSAGDGISDPVTANITVNQVNDPPTADDEAYTTDEDTPVDILVSDLMTGDTVGPLNEQDDQSLSFVSVGGAVNGTVSESGGTVTFTPDADFNGTASFTYTVTDDGVSGAGAGTADPQSATATVTITVNPVNDPPVAADDDIADIAEDSGTYNISGATLTGNDSPGPLESDALTVTTVSNVVGGTAGVVGGNVEFDPTADYFGPAGFDYTVSDGELTDTASVTFDILPVADPPSVTAATTDEDTQSTSGLVISRNPADGTEVTHFKVTAITNGTLYQNDGTTQINSGDFITYAQGNAGLKFTPDADFNGTGSFTVQASVTADDTGLGGGTVTADITVNAVNDPPVADDETLADLAEDTPLTVPFADLLDGDTAGPANESGQTLTITAVSNAVGGTAAINGTNVEFTPTANYHGAAGFTYTLADDASAGGPALADEGSVSFAITPVADTPSVTGATTIINAQTTDGLVISRNPADGAEVTHFKITAITDGSLYQNDGTTQINNGDFITYAEGNAGLKFTPATDFVGTATFEIRASLSNGDSGLGGSTVTAEITVLNVPDLTLTKDDGGIRATPGSTITYTLTYENVGGLGATGVVITETVPDYTTFDAGASTSGWSCADGSPAGTACSLTVGSVAAGTGGSVTFAVTVVADPPVVPDTSNTASIADDGAGGADPNPGDNSDTETTALNTRAPVADDDAYSTPEDTALSVPAPGVLDGDTDADGDALATATLVDDAAHGTLTLNADGSFTYTPDPDWNGSDSFTYRTTDGQLDSNTATAAITVTPVNDAPVATDGTLEAGTGAPAAGTLAATDVDGDSLTYGVAAAPAQGTVTITDAATGAYTYAANPAASGTDSFTFKANDGAADSNVATVTVYITAADDDAYTTPEDTVLTVPAPGVLDGDSDGTGDPLTAMLVSGTANGDLALNADGSLIYTPDPDWHGTDTFTYRSTDGAVESSAATVTITVTPVNDAPVAQDGSFRVRPGGTLSGILSAGDVDGDALTFSIVTPPARGTVTITDAATGAFTYKANAGATGSDSFTFKANDGAADSNVATMAVTFRRADAPPSNQAPAAASDEYTTLAGTLLAVAAPGVLANDSDPDGDPLTAVLVSGPAHGTLSLSSDGSFAYTPAPAFTGPDQFAYRAHDGTANSNTATVTITVTAVPDTIPPAWPPGATLTAAEVGSASLRLSWPAATDNVGVTGYRIFLGGELIGSVAGTTHVVAGLGPGTTYTFRVQACDASGNCSAGGPATTVTTLPAGAPGPGAPPPPDECPADVCAPIDPAGGDTVADADQGVTIDFPAGAIQGSGGGVEVQLTTLSPVEVAQQLGGAGMPPGFRAIGRAFEIEVAGGTVSGPVTLTITLTPEELRGVTDPEKIGLFRLNADGSLTFVGGKLVDGKLVVTLSSFSTYVLGEVNITFTDMPGHWARSDVELMASKYVVQGLPDGRFDPGAPVTRAQFAAMLVRAMGLNTAAAGSGTMFTDVRPGDWYYGEVMAAVSAGIVQGMGDGTFAPNAPVTREQVAAMVMRALHRSGKGPTLTAAQAQAALAPFADRGAVSAWAVPDLAAAVQAGIIRGDAGGALAPGARASRAEAATIIARFWRE